MMRLETATEYVVTGPLTKRLNWTADYKFNHNLNQYTILIPAICQDDAIKLHCIKNHQLL